MREAPEISGAFRFSDAAFNPLTTDHLIPLSYFRVKFGFAERSLFAIMGISIPKAANEQIKIPRKSTIFRKTLPLMVCELSDALIIFTGILFLTLEDEIYLAAIGLIDAILLCSLAYGHALSDAFQNFYARRRSPGGGADEISLQVHKASIRDFGGVAIAILVCGVALLCLFAQWHSNDVLDLVYGAVPLLIPIILFYYIALSFHAFLLGQGHLRWVGFAATGSFIFHLALLFGLLQMVELKLPPTQIVLLAMLLSELVWLLILWCIFNGLGYGKRAIIAAPSEFTKLSQIRLRRVIMKVAIGPGASAMTFHLASSLLFVYLSSTRGPSEVAALSVAMGYYALLIAPANGILAAATNGYARLYSQNRQVLFTRFRKNLFAISFGMACIVGICFLLAHSLGLPCCSWNYPLMLVTTLVALISIRNKLDFAAVLTRLRTDVYWRYQTIYALLIFVGIALLQNMLGVKAITLIMLVLFGQGAIAISLHKRVQILWRPKVIVTGAT